VKAAFFLIFLATAAPAARRRRGQGPAA